MAEANGGVGEDGGAARRSSPTRRASVAPGDDSAVDSISACANVPNLGNPDTDVVRRNSSTPEFSGARERREQLDAGTHLGGGRSIYSVGPKPPSADSTDGPKLVSKRPSGSKKKEGGSLPTSISKFLGFSSSKKSKVEEKQQPNLTGGSAAGLGPNRGGDAPEHNGNNPKNKESKN